MGATAANWILGQPWAMLPDMIETLVSIADRTNDVEAVLAKRGEPLDNTRTVEMHDGVAVIPVRGPISRYGDMFSEISGATSVDGLARDFRAAIDSPEVRGIVLEMDTPGGQAAGIGELAAMIRAGSKVKPVTCYVSNLGASAGLWLACAANKVVLAPQAIMGSMGVAWPVSRPNEKDKARTIEFVSSQSPNKRPDVESDAGRGEMQRVVDAMAQVFIDDVSSYRKLDPKKAVAQFGRGGLLVGRACVDAGMADRLGSLESCISDLSRPKNRPNRGYSIAGAHSKANMKKINLFALFSGLMSKADDSEIDAAVAREAIDEAAGESDEGNEVATTIETTRIAAPTLEVSIEAAREQLRKEMQAELRVGRIQVYTDQAEVFLTLNADKTNPAETANLKAAFVAGALIDAENPVAGYSVLDAFKATIAGRKPHHLTTEVISGDASQVADRLSKENLKILDTGATTPDEARAQASAKRIEEMLGATEEGRNLLATGRKVAK